MRHGESESNRYLETAPHLEQQLCNAAYTHEQQTTRVVISPINGETFTCSRFIDSRLTESGVIDGLEAGVFWETRDPENFGLVTSVQRRASGTLLLSLRGQDLSKLKVTADIRLREVTFHRQIDCELPAKEKIKAHTTAYLHELIDTHFAEHQRKEAHKFVKDRWHFLLEDSPLYVNGCNNQDYMVTLLHHHKPKKLFIAGHSGMARCLMHQISDTDGNAEFERIEGYTHGRCCLPDNGSIFSFEWQRDPVFRATNRGYLLKSMNECGKHLPTGVKQICESWEELGVM